jgi:hypothetical protein
MVLPLEVKKAQRVSSTLRARLRNQRMTWTSKMSSSGFAGENLTDSMINICMDLLTFLEYSDQNHPRVDDAGDIVARALTEGISVGASRVAAAGLLLKVTQLSRKVTGADSKIIATQLNLVAGLVALVIHSDRS